MKYADLNCGDYFKVNERTYIVGESFFGDKIPFQIDQKGCGLKCFFRGSDEVKYTTTYEYDNPYLSNIGQFCNLNSAPYGQPLYIPDTDEYIVKFIQTTAFLVSGENAGEIIFVHTYNPKVQIVDKVHVQYCEG